LDHLNEKDDDDDDNDNAVADDNVGRVTMLACCLSYTVVAPLLAAMESPFLVVSNNELLIVM
jgi:hypothetical protein